LISFCLHFLFYSDRLAFVILPFILYLYAIATVTKKNTKNINQQRSLFGRYQLIPQDYIPKNFNPTPNYVPTISRIGLTLFQSFLASSVDLLASARVSATFFKFPATSFLSGSFSFASSATVLRRLAL
jgi:hypothetical protein